MIIPCSAMNLELPVILLQEGQFLPPSRGRPRQPGDFNPGVFWLEHPDPKAPPGNSLDFTSFAPKEAIASQVSGSVILDPHGRHCTVCGKRIQPPRQPERQQWT